MGTGGGAVGGADVGPDDVCGREWRKLFLRGNHLLFSLSLSFSLSFSLSLLFSFSFSASLLDSLTSFPATLFLIADFGDVAGEVEGVLPAEDEEEEEDAEDAEEEEEVDDFFTSSARAFFAFVFFAPAFCC